MTQSPAPQPERGERVTEQSETTVERQPVEDDQQQNDTQDDGDSKSDAGK